MYFIFLAIHIFCNLIFNVDTTSIKQMKVKNNFKIITQPFVVVKAESIADCALQCHHSNCCAASYNNETNSCYFKESICFFDTEPSSDSDFLYKPG